MTERAEFEVGEAVWYYRAANLGGAAGVAALRAQWREGVVVRHVVEAGGFLLYEVDGIDGSKATFAKAHVKKRHVAPTTQFDDPVPEDWYNVPQPYHGSRKRVYRR